MIEQTYQRATGWLGWTDEAAMDTPLSRIYLALEGKMDFLRKTNPFRTKEDVENDRIREGTPESAAASMEQMFMAMRMSAKPLPKRTKGGE